MGFIADIFTADKAADAQKDASRDAAAASQYATDKTIGLQKEIFDKLWGGTQVQRDAGDAATRMMSQLMGLSLPAAAQTGQPRAQPALTTPRGANLGTKPSYAEPMMFGQNALMRADPLSDPQTLPASGAALTPQTTAAPTQGNALDPTAWLRSTPGYQFNFDEGARALNTKLAGQGRLQSGDAAREAVRYGQNYGDRIFGDQFNRLAAIAGAGQTATSQGAQAGTNYANQSSNALQQNAQNLGSSYQNRGNAISGFWGDMGGSFGSDAVMRAAGTFMKGGF